MKIDIELRPDSKETRVVIYTPEITDEVQEIINNLKRTEKKRIIGNKDERIYILSLDDIFCFYSQNGKIFAQTENTSYEVREKLYRLEEDLIGTSFIRISKFAIANVDKIKNLELLFNGNMCLNFINGGQEQISRRYVSRFKKFLDMGGK